jgi:hypothetical protein
MTQCDMILRHLRSGRTLTSLQAFRLFTITRVSDRCRDLRKKGIPVKSEMIRLNSGLRVAQYSL